MEIIGKDLPLLIISTCFDQSGYINVRKLDLRTSEYIVKTNNNGDVVKTTRGLNECIFGMLHHVGLLHRVEGTHRYYYNSCSQEVELPPIEIYKTMLEEIISRFKNFLIRYQSDVQLYSSRVIADMCKEVSYTPDGQRNWLYYSLLEILTCRNFLYKRFSLMTNTKNGINWYHPLPILEPCPTKLKVVYKNVLNRLKSVHPFEVIEDNNV